MNDSIKGHALYSVFREKILFQCFRVRPLLLLQSHQSISQCHDRYSFLLFVQSTLEDSKLIVMTDVIDGYA